MKFLPCLVLRFFLLFCLCFKERREGIEVKSHTPINAEERRESCPEAIQEAIGGRGPPAEPRAGHKSIYIIT